MIPKAAIDIIVDLWPILFLCIITTICLKVAYSLANHTKLELYKEMINLVFIAYVIMLFSLVTATDFSSFSNNFVPFKEIFRYSFNSKLFYRNVIGNVAIFVPFGYYVNYYCTSKNITYSLLITLIVSTTIETIQLALGRSFDIDDIILNVSGAIIGFLLYIGLCAIKKHLPKFLQRDFVYNIICIMFTVLIVLYFLKIMGIWWF